MCATWSADRLPLTPGQQAKILPSGLAAAPSDAPSTVKLAIAAGNQLISKPYIWGGGHGVPLSQLDAGYDCSGATSYILHAAGALGLYAEDSTQLESYGQPGPGAWITVYANSGHAFIAVAGIVMNTAWYAPVNPTVPDSGPRWQPASTITRPVRRRPVRRLRATPPRGTLKMRRRLVSWFLVPALAAACAHRLRDL